MGKHKPFSSRSTTKSQSKFRYFKYVDSYKKESWVKVPKISCWQKVILARQILRFKYEGLPPLQHNSKLFPVRSMIRKACRRSTISNAHAQISASSIKKTSAVFSGGREGERWQNYDWKNRILRDACRYEVLEIVENQRMFNVDSSRFKVSSVALLEAARKSILNHDWHLVSKYIEVLVEECKRNSNSWLIWNGGFLALANLQKNNIESIAEFAEHCRCVLHSFPKRLGIEIAIWFSQKGYFVRGLNLLMDWHQQWGKDICFNRKRYLHNLKRYQVELVSTLFLAVHSYVKWKRDLNMQKSNHFTGSALAVRRSGEYALTQFENALDFANKSDADVTFFVKPLIELTMEFKTEFAARELFLELVQRHKRNFVLEMMYLVFIQENFQFLEEEIKYFRERRKLYKWRKYDDRMGLFKLRNWRNGLLQQKSSFEKILIPTYTL